MCEHRCDRRPKVGKLPTPSRHRSPTLTPTVRGSRLTPAAASRCSKICPIDRPRRHVCKHRCDRRPKVGKLHCLRRRAHALRHSLRLRTPTGTVAAAVAGWSKIDRVDDRRHYVCCILTRDPRSGTLSAIAAQMLSDTRFGCARPRAQSPHLGFTLPPRVGRMHLRHATRSGREIRVSETRSAARIGRRTCRAADPSTYPPV